MISGTPSELEIQNAKKVLGFLSDMKDVSFKNVREDIFKVSKAETKGIICVVDVEEAIVCLSVDVCDVPEDNEAELDNFFMGLNSAAVHGKFVKTGKKYYFRDNLEFANLDSNELEASLKWSFGMVGANVQKISNIISTGEIGEDIDLEDNEIDLEDLMDAGEVVEDLIEIAVNAVNAMSSTERVEEVTEERPAKVFEQQEDAKASFSEPDTSNEDSSSDSGGSDD